MIFQANKTEAFSLIEAVVSITLVFVAFIAITGSIIEIIKSENIVKNDIVVYSLAKEGLELTRYVRDKNLQDGLNFYNKLTENTSPVENDISTFIIDYRVKNSLDNISQTPNTFSDSSTILFKDSEGFFAHDSSGTSTAYKRLITTVMEIGYLSVKSEISWNENGFTKTYSLEDRLYNQGAIVQ